MTGERISAAAGERLAKQVRRQLGLASDTPWPAILDALDAALEERATPPPAPTPAKRHEAAAETPIADVISWGVETGRFSPARAEFWARHAEDERRRTGSAAQVEVEIRSLHPVYEPPADRVASPSVWARDPDGHVVHASSWASSTDAGEEFPLTREMERSLFGLSAEERKRADLVATASGRWPRTSSVSVLRPQSRA